MKSTSDMAAFRYMPQPPLFAADLRNMCQATASAARHPSQALCPNFGTEAAARHNRQRRGLKAEQTKGMSDMNFCGNKVMWLGGNNATF